MNVRFRVTIAPIGGEPVAVEHFENRQDCTSFYDALMVESESNILLSLPFKTTVVSCEEFYEGSWVLLNRRVVALN